LTCREPPEGGRAWRKSRRSTVPDTLDSGWALGQEYLDSATAVAEAKVGEGKVLIMGPEVTFRGEPHATFKFLFNGVLYSGAH